MRVLLTRLSAMGDVIHAWPLAAALRRAVPGVEIAWVVEEELLPLVARHPDVAQAIPVATRRWRRAPFTRATRAELGGARAQIVAFAPEVALDPQGLLKSAAWARLAGVPRRIGFAARARRERLAGAFYTATVLPPAEVRHVVDLNLTLLTALGLEPPYGAAPDAGFLRGGPDPAGIGTAGAIALLPGAGRAEKAWEWRRFAELGARLAGAGQRPLLVWGPGERPLAERIAAAAGDTVALAPPTSLPELSTLLASCRVVVGGDTGPVHLAAALGTATVAIHLASSAARNGARGPRVHLIDGAAAAAGVRSARSGRRRDVTVDEVWVAIEALLSGNT